MKNAFVFKQIAINSLSQMDTPFILFKPFIRFFQSPSIYPINEGEMGNELQF